MKHLLVCEYNEENLKILNGCTSFTSIVPRYAHTFVEPTGYAINLFTRRYWEMYHIDGARTHITTDQLIQLIMLVGYLKMDYEEALELAGVNQDV